jgi:hypothetical protein
LSAIFNPQYVWPAGSYRFDIICYWAPEVTGNDNTVISSNFFRQTCNVWVEMRIHVIPQSRNEIAAGG